MPAGIYVTCTGTYCIYQYIPYLFGDGVAIAAPAKILGVGDLFEDITRYSSFL